MAWSRNYRVDSLERPPIPGIRDPVALRHWRRWGLAAAGVAIVLAGYLHFARDGASSPAPRIRVAPVRVAEIERRDMPMVEHTLGTVVANATVQITARVPGLLESACFKEGQFVNKGELLLQIDPRPFRAALQQARATLARDQALLRNARRDERRYEKLLEENSATAQQRDTAATNVDTLRATVTIDEAALDVARLNLGYTQIRSPIDGKTGPLLVQPGNMISGTAGVALVTIAQMQPIKLSFELPQSDYPRIRAGLRSHLLTVTVDRPAAQGGPLVAPISFTNNTVNSQSGTIQLRATFANTDLSLLPAETVNVTVRLSELRNVLVIPENALNDGPNGPYVYGIVDGKAVTRPVTVLYAGASHAAVAGDVRPGDAVIVEGQLRVVPGGPVKVFPPAHVPLSLDDRNLEPEYGPDNSPGGRP